MDARKISKERADKIKQYFSGYKSFKAEVCSVADSYNLYVMSIDLHFRLALFEKLQTSPQSPAFELDGVFSRTLIEKQKTRNDTLSASTLDYFENSSILHTTKPFQDTKNILPCTPKFQIGTPTKTMDESWLQVSDESFLEMERQCNMDATMKVEKPASFDETQLFDVDPPSEFWNSTIQQSFAVADQTPSEASENSVLVVRRPSTIVEETSSQMSSMNRVNTTTSSTSSSIVTANNESHIVNRNNSTTSSGSFKSAANDFSDSLRLAKRKYRFFEDEEATPKVTVNSERSTVLTPSPIDTVTKRRRPFFTTSNTNTPESKRPLDDTDDDRTPCNTNRQFNDTLEAIDFMLEEGKRREDAKKNATIAPTPLFSCKRTRVLNEMATTEILSFSRRGPLIDLMGTPNTDRKPVTK